MIHFYHGLNQAWESLKNRPGFVFSVVTTMGVTLGAFICVTALAYELLSKPLPYPDADKLFRVEQIKIRGSGVIDHRSFSYAGLLAFYKEQTIFSKASLIEYSENVVSSLPSQPLMELSYVTPEWFSLLGMDMHLGRYFDNTEGVDSNIPVAVLSYETWSNDFESDPDILEKKFILGGISFRVIGVVNNEYIEPEIHQTGRKTKIWLPWNLSPNKDLRSNWERLGRFFAVGKLKPEISVKQAESRITPIANKLWTDNIAGVSVYKGWHIKMQLNTFKYYILGDIDDTIFQLIFAMFALLVLAAANVANLFMARTAERYRELSLRAALGGTKAKLFKDLFVEASLLLLFSMFIAVIVSALGFYLIENNLSNLFPRIHNLSLNRSSFFVAIISVFLFSFLFAKISSEIINRQSLSSALRSSGKGTGVQISKNIRQFLIAIQVAIATCLVFININLHQLAVSTINEPMGFEIKNIYSLHLTYSGDQRPTSEALISIMDEFETNLSVVPQVDSIARTTAPYHGFGEWVITDATSNTSYTVNGKEINHQYFQMIEQPLIEGNYFTKSDIKSSNNVTIINQAFAKRISPDKSALGMKLRFGDVYEFRIVGVVKDANIPGRMQVPISIYVPTSLVRMGFTIKIKPKHKLTREHVVKVLKDTNPNFSVHSFSPLTDSYEQWLATEIMTSYTTVILALVSLFLAAIGLYGILSYDSKIRRFELGIRLALGAKSNSIISLILRDNLRSLGIGIASGIIILLVGYLLYDDELSKYINVDLFWNFIVTLLFIVTILFITCYFPLRSIINRQVIFSLRGND